MAEPPLVCFIHPDPTEGTERMWLALSRRLSGRFIHPDPTEGTERLLRYTPMARKSKFHPSRPDRGY